MTALAADPTTRTESPVDADLFDRTVERIMEESGAGRSLVEGFVTTVIDNVEVLSGVATPDTAKYWHPRGPWLERYHDTVFATIMPDNEIAGGPDTAHGLLNEVCSGLAGQPVTLTHVNTGDGAAVDCAVLVSVAVTA